MKKPGICSYVKVSLIMSSDFNKWESLSGKMKFFRKVTLTKQLVFL